MTNKIEKTIQVPLRPHQAFDIFTKNIGDWWPSESHSLSAAEGETPKSVKCDTQEGGYITETKFDGETCRWGTITKWDTGRELQISWYVGRDEREATDLKVVFLPTDIGTRIELTHSGFDRLGSAASAMLTSYETGWDYVLGDRYFNYCSCREKLSISTQ